MVVLAGSGADRGLDFEYKRKGGALLEDVYWKIM